jgi:carbon starvation protein CstA
MWQNEMITRLFIWLAQSIRSFGAGANTSGGGASATCYGFRFGFHGFSDVSVWGSFSILAGLAVILTAMNLYYLKKGTGLKN